MKKLIFGTMLICLLALTLGLAGCATYSTVDGVRTPLGAFTSAKVNASRADVIAEYTIILGIITSGYENFLEATKGKDIDIIDESMFFIVKVKAVARK